jgi:hypothetical protein
MTVSKCKIAPDGSSTAQQGPGVPQNSIPAPLQQGATISTLTFLLIGSNTHEETKELAVTELPI